MKLEKWLFKIIKKLTESCYVRWKVENLGDHLLDQTQILNLNLDDQCIFYESFQWWPPSMKDGLKILKVEYHIL